MSRSSAGVLSTLIADRSGDTSQATQLFLLLVVRRTLQDGGKWDMRQGPEELMRRQATAREFGRSQAAEEASEGTRVNERIGLLAAQEGGLVPEDVVNGDRRTMQ